MEPSSTKWHAKSLEEIYSALESSKEGITEAQAGERLQKYGTNEMRRAKKDTAFLILLRQFKSLVLWILITAALISFSIGHAIEFIVILIIILLIIIISFSMEYKASKDMDALIKMTPQKSVVIRNSEKIEVDSKNLVVGDILVLTRGDIVGSDE